MTLDKGKASDLHMDFNIRRICFLKNNLPAGISRLARVTYWFPQLLLGCALVLSWALDTEPPFFHVKTIFHYRNSGCLWEKLCPKRLTTSANRESQAHQNPHSEKTCLALMLSVVGEGNREIQRSGTLFWSTAHRHSVFFTALLGNDRDRLTYEQETGISVDY